MILISTYKILGTQNIIKYFSGGRWS